MIIEGDDFAGSSRRRESSWSVNGYTVVECDETSVPTTSIDDRVASTSPVRTPASESLTIVNHPDGDGDATRFGAMRPTGEVEITVDLGNGNDTLAIEYGGVGVQRRPDRRATTSDDPTSDNDTTELGSNSVGDWVNLDDSRCTRRWPIDDDDGTANVQSSNAENLVDQRRRRRSSTTPTSRPRDCQFDGLHRYRCGPAPATFNHGSTFNCVSSGRRPDRFGGSPTPSSTAAPATTRPTSRTSPVR